MKQHGSSWIFMKIRAHLEMWRPYTVIWSGMVGLVGACLACGGLPKWDIALLALFIPMMGWIGGLYLADIFDRNLDKIEKPHRPIPSGRVSVREAFLMGLILALAGVGLIIWKLNMANLLLAGVILVLVMLYSFVLKSQGMMGHLNRGLMTVTAYVFGVMCINQPISAVPVYVWILSLVFLLHDTDSNLVGAIRDMKGDREGGYMTVPAKYGLKASIWISLSLTCIWWVLAVGLCLWYDIMSTWFYVAIALDAAILIVLYIYMFRSLPRCSRERALMFHEIFVIERIVLATAFLFGLIPPLYALLVAVLALTFTEFAQIKLRREYEFEEGTGRDY